MASIRTKTRPVCFLTWLRGLFQDKPTVSRELSSRKTNAALPQLSPTTSLQFFLLSGESHHSIWQPPYPYYGCVPNLRVRTWIRWFVIWLSTPLWATAAASFICKVSDLVCLQRRHSRDSSCIIQSHREESLKLLLITDKGIFENRSNLLIKWMS